MTFQVTTRFGPGFMSVCGGHFEFCWVLYLVNIYIYIYYIIVCQMESHSEFPVGLHILTLLT